MPRVRQIEQRPLVGARIVFRDLVGAPQVGPDVVALVDRDLIGLLRFRVRQRDQRRLLGVDVDLGEGAAEGIADLDQSPFLSAPMRRGACAQANGALKSGGWKVS